MPDGFEPKVVDGPFSYEVERFYFAGLVSPLSAWADACGIGYPRDDDWQAYCHLTGDGVLPLDAKDIERACRDAFGEPRPARDRGFPGSADWVLTTPMEGIYLTVNLQMETDLRFGWGVVMGSHPRPSYEAIQAAITETLRVVHAAMEPRVAPSP